MHRIVTLLPSATEIVAALGFGEQLAGRSHECDHPPSVAALPACTAPKFETEGPSAVLDQRVRTIVENALSVYSVDAAALRRIDPDVIVTQSQCEVCAVSISDVEDAVAEWLGARPRIVSLSARDLSGIWDDIERVGASLDAPARGSELTGRLKARAAAIAKRAGKLHPRPTVGCIEWLDPLMSAGNWMPELVEMAGGEMLYAQAGAHSPRISFADLRTKDPDAIVIAPCGFKIERTLGELATLTERPGWAELRAVRNGRVWIADGNQYFNRPGPRIVDSLEILAELIHPEVFSFGHRAGGAWRRV